MNSHPFAYTRRESPCLLATAGQWEFLHLAHRYPEHQRVRRLRLQELGYVHVPSGHLVIADPFSGMRREGNGRLNIAPGAYRVLQTLIDQSPEQTGTSWQVAALTIVLDEGLFARRQEYQNQALSEGYSQAIPSQALAYIYPDSAGGSFEEETGEGPAHLEIRSGAVAVVDATLLAQHMPLDRADAGSDWLDAVFAHGLPGSWFDAMDSDHPLPPGAANLPLPHGHADQNIVLSRTGDGDGRYAILVERAFDFGDRDEEDRDAWMVPEWQVTPPVSALHVDFRLIPADPFHPMVSSPEE